MQLDVTSDERIEGLTFEFQREIADLKGDAVLLPDRRILLPTLETGGRIHIQIQFHAGQSRRPTKFDENQQPFPGG